MNEDNPNNLNNNVGGDNLGVANGQTPEVQVAQNGQVQQNVQPQNPQVQNVQGQNPQGQSPQEPNPYAQTYNPGMQNMNAQQPFMQNPQMNPNNGQSKAGPVKKHGMSVITTIILLVLIAVVVLGGHFIYKQVKTPTNTINSTRETVNNIGNTVTGTTSNLKVGAYITYKPDAADPYVVNAEYTGQEKVSTISQNPNMHWRVFKVEDDYIELIATVPTEDTLTLSGAIGYNNGVYLLNDICKNLYSNNSLNAVARSITIEDITSKIPEDSVKISGYAPIENTYKTYTGANSLYPDLYQYENGSGIGKAVQYIEHSSLKQNATTEGANNANNIEIDYEEIVDVKNNGCTQSDSYYTTPVVGSESNKGYKVATNQQFTATHTAFTSNVTNCFSNDAYGPMFYGTQKKYWLASRYVNCAYNEMANFGLRTVNSNSLEIVKMFDSDGSSFSVSYSIFPIVTIKNYKIESGIGTARDPIVLQN